MVSRMTEAPGNRAFDYLSVDPGNMGLLHQAAHWRPLKGGGVACALCAHGCELGSNEVGLCGVRKNVGGTLFTRAYGNVVACQPTPIERLHLFHYHPGRTVLCVATPGCNFHCLYCTNYDLAFVPRNWDEINWGERLSPAEVVTVAQVGGWQTIAFAYTEPTIFFEFVLDIARLATKVGLNCVMATNGYIQESPLQELLPLLSAVSLDLKSFRNRTYRTHCNARLEPVLETLKRVKRAGVWVEVITTIIPTVNDSEQEWREIARFLVALDAGIPWHLNRFYPSFAMQDIPVTPSRILARAWEIGREEGLRYVYTDTMVRKDAQQTLCHLCGYILVDRGAQQAISINITGDYCPRCGSIVDNIVLV